jgi:hypothetical protein
MAAARRRGSPVRRVRDRPVRPREMGAREQRLADGEVRQHPPDRDPGHRPDPIELLLIVALIRRGGKLSFQGITIDLAAGRPAVDLRINTNIGVAGETVSDTSSAQILDALNRAAKSDVVVVDVENGKAWWETRLLVLSAGGARTGRPRKIVFVTSERGQSRAFLGWATPTSLVEALFDPSNPRHTIYRKAHALALEAGEKWQ